MSSDGVIETDEQFLKRMTGIVRFYAAIIQTSLPNAANPHGLKHGWAWLARVLNKDPHPSITATVLYDFLEVNIVQSCTYVYVCMYVHVCTYVCIVYAGNNLLS